MTYIRIKNLSKSITERKEQEEYLQRLHIGLQATALIGALGAALDKKDIKMEDLIGKAPGEEIKCNQDISEWKGNAKQRGLKTSDA